MLCTVVRTRKVYNPPHSLTQRAARVARRGRCRHCLSVTISTMFYENLYKNGAFTSDRVVLLSFRRLTRSYSCCRVVVAGLTQQAARFAPCGRCRIRYFFPSFIFFSLKSVPKEFYSNLFVESSPHAFFFLLRTVSRSHYRLTQQAARVAPCGRCRHRCCLSSLLCL